MIKDTFINQVASMSEVDFAQVLPFLEADLEAAASLDGLRDEIKAGRDAVEKEPLLPADEVYARVRRKLSS